MKIMDKNSILEILVVNHSTPEISGYATLLLKNVIPILRKTIQVHVTWIIHNKEKIENKQLDSNSSIMNMVEFDNAVQALEKIKPDIVFIIPGISVPDYAFNLAAKYLNIPTMGGDLGMTAFGDITVKKSLNSFNPFKNKKDLKGFLSIGKFFIIKHIFLLKTEVGVGMNYLQVIKDFINFTRKYFPVFRPTQIFMPEFACDINFVQNHVMFEKLIEIGWDRKKLAITGNPSYEEIENKLPISRHKHNEKINVLILTMNFIGADRKSTLYKIESLIDEINNMQKISVSIKIHPSQEDPLEYKQILQKFKDIKLYQKEDLYDILKNTDVAISFTSATASYSAVLAHIPVIIWNIHNVENDILLKYGLAKELKEIKDAINMIEHSLLRYLPNEDLDKFKKEILNITDKRPSEKIANIIIQFLNLNKQ